MAKKMKHQQRIPVKQKPKLPPALKKFSFDAPTDKKRVLHIGWGSAISSSLLNRFKTPEWEEIRLDPEPAAAPDIISALTVMKDVPDNAVDAVWAQHVLHRFAGPDVALILQECKRVLKPLGYMVLTVPDGQTAAAYVAHSRGDEALFQTPVGPITAIDLIYGFRLNVQRGVVHQQHRFLFSAELLGTIMRDAGFTNIRVHRRNTFDIMAIGYKYPYDHAERAERIEIVQEQNLNTLPAPELAQKPTPQTALPAQQLRGPRGLSDELDIPPGQWKALGLKHKK